MLELCILFKTTKLTKNINKINILHEHVYVLRSTSISLKPRHKDKNPGIFYKDNYGGENSSLIRSKSSK